jgi:hypothetical protein
MVKDVRVKAHIRRDTPLRKGTIVPRHHRLVQERIKILARKFNVPKPKVKFVDMNRHTKKVFNFDNATDPGESFVGDYDIKEKAILVDKNKYTPKTAEHEFKHYLQHLEKPKTFEKDDIETRKLARESYQKWSKRYDRNHFEDEAFAFEKKKVI